MPGARSGEPYRDRAAVAAFPGAGPAPACPNIYAIRRSAPSLSSGGPPPSIAFPCPADCGLPRKPKSATLVSNPTRIRGCRRRADGRKRCSGSAGIAAAYCGDFRQWRGRAFSARARRRQPPSRSNTRPAPSRQSLRRRPMPATAITTSTGRNTRLTRARPCVRARPRSKIITPCRSASAPVAVDLRHRERSDT